jgi:aldehyde:ferredoxin oxidoreductase
MADFGYAGEILNVDLSRQHTSRLATADYTDRFLGGKGVAAKLYWDMVPSQTRAFDPENCLICVSGPVAGFTGFASSRWLACGKSAAGDPEAFSYANLGGSWGNRLKYAGYDGIVLQGKADKPVYLFLHDNTLEIRDATHLWGKSAFEASYSLKAELGKAVSVLTIGQAAENLVVFATLLADEGASGSAGMGSVMGSKNLKAIAVAGDKKPVAANPERLRQLASRMRELTRGPLPPMWWVIPGRTKPQACHGCGLGCARQSYTDENGHRFKSFCQAIDAYREPAERYYKGWNEVILLAMRLFDKYGLDTSVMQGMITWLIRCYEAGVLRDKDTGLPLSKIGSTEFIEALTRKIALREGFGEILARGTIKAAESVGCRAKELTSLSVLNVSNETRDYEPRMLLHNTLLIATEPRRALQQIHEPSQTLMVWLAGQDGRGDGLSHGDFRYIAEKYWGSAAAADYDSYEGKALAAKRIQDRTYALESFILCNQRWPMLHNRIEPRVGGPALASQILSAVTGREMDEGEMEKVGERIFNMQRAVLLRQGWGGRQGDRLLDYYYEEPLPGVFFNAECIAPGKDGEVISRKGAVLEREKVEKMKDEYYELRGWHVASGLQTEARLKELQLADVARDLAQRGLLG